MGPALTTGVPLWPAELAGAVHWPALCADLGGRHVKHMPRAAALAVEIILILRLTQPDAWRRVWAWMEAEFNRRVLALREAETREVLSKRYGIPADRLSMTG